ncbi:MAG TPA: hypothetical protein VM536_14045 [Chloroflexia bacterium]|nr:hypothetical protein [Chloroflexia bacterium]
MAESIAGRSGPWAAVGAVALAMLYGRVALAHLTTAVVGGDVDGFQNLWNRYWVQKALFDLHQSPFFTTYLYYPTGTSLRYHTLAPANGVLAAPFDLLFGRVTVTNVLPLVALALTTFCTFLLLRDLVGDPWGAFAGAALFTYGSRQVLGFYSLGAANLVMLQWLPLYFFFLFRSLHGRPRWAADGTLALREMHRPLVYGALAVLTLVIMSLTDWQFIVWAVLTTLLYGAFLLTTRRPWAEKGRLIGALAAIGGAYTLLVLPTLVWPMVQEALTSPWLSVGYQSGLHSLDLAALLAPGLDNPGYLAVGAAVLGVVTAARGTARATAWFWALIVGLFYVMALGPALLFNGQETGIPLPYALLQNLPVLNIGRDPGRYVLIGLLGIAVLVALGLKQLGVWLTARLGRGRPAGPVVRGTLAVLFLVVSLTRFVAAAWDAKADAPDWPPFYQQIARDPEPYAVLQLPAFTENGHGEDHYMMYQALHQKPLFGGHLARDHKLTNPANFVKHASLYREFWMLQSPRQPRTENYPEHDFLQRTDYATQGRAILNYYHTRYIVLLKEALYPGWDDEGFQSIIRQVLGPEVRPSYEDGQTRVYTVPPGPPPAIPLTLDVGAGWYASESRPDGIIYRWADVLQPDTTPELYSMNLDAAPHAATLRFTAYAYQQSRTLDVLLDGSRLTRLQLAAGALEQPVALDLTLTSGNHLLSFQTPEPPLPTGSPADHRLLSFGLYGVSLQAR